jgi:hypothetical protein
MRPFKLVLAILVLAGAWAYNRARPDEAGAVEASEAVSTDGTVGSGMAEVAAAQVPEGYEQLLRSGNGRYIKGGWNHYGPGYFELDPATGVLTAHGGMGLFWYSVKEYSDFVLELEFMCSAAETNSGVFVRVPGVPTSGYIGLQNHDDLAPVFFRNIYLKDLG